MTNAENFLKVDSKEVKDSRGRDSVVDCLKDVELKLFDLFDGQFFVSNLLEDHLHFEWVDILVLARDKHRGHPDNVQIANLSPFLLVLKVSVKKRDGKEEGLVVTLKVGEHLDHPVNHASS